MKQSPATGAPLEDVTPALGRVRPRSASDRHPLPTALLYGYLLLTFIEYTGLNREVGAFQAIRLSTLLTYGMVLVVLAKGGGRGLLQHVQLKIFLALTFMTCLSVTWAVVRSRAIVEIQPFFDYMAVFVLTARLISDEKRRKWLGIIFAIIAMVIVARNLGPLGSEVRIGGLKAGYFLGDNNDFAWGLVVVLPLILHLLIGKRSLFVRLIAICGLIACVAGVIGSGSRGGSIGLFASFFYLWMFVSPYKGRLAALLLVAGCVVLALAPSSYFDRMASVGSYEEDSSAQARLQVWKAGFHMALDFPLGVGAGNFPSAYGRYYVPPEEQNAISWAGQRWLAAHSIYFRAMGEYGFLGLLMMVWVIVRTFRDNAQSRKQLLAKPDADVASHYWPAMLNASVIGYAICGIFLGGITYPHIFLLAGLTAALKERLNPPSTPASRTGRRRG